MTGRTVSHTPVLILGVAESDAHAVANHLIAMYLRESGFEVVNLGVCTPLTEFADAQSARPEAVAVLIGSINGHAAQDLRDLPALRAVGRLTCPVIVGGNLSVGSRKSGDEVRRLTELGVDHVLRDLHELLPLLDTIVASRPRSPSGA
ncbi:cobalamin-dependent protein [Dactylosporangium fulvum]|uniref:Cobalamin-dependent protein n=1 Tax=Dactylosporangium fulvum TaxID=53359 RepID=A0ABY5VS30_9ACTN|nr:cobalamin-dependent protein [Dactylosporangium fulvum]UWP79894.1 cobalamin-dependent protein [Dactylosporangium fulvum]